MWGGSPSVCFWVMPSRFASYPVAPNSGRTSCQAGARILLGFLRGLDSGRRNASNHSVSDICQRSSYLKFSLKTSRCDIGDISSMSHHVLFKEHFPLLRQRVVNVLFGDIKPLVNLLCMVGIMLIGIVRNDGNE